MPAIQDFAWTKFDDGFLQVSMEPPFSVAGIPVNFNLGKRFGGAGNLIVKSAASGCGGGQSGITVANSGAGVVNVAIAQADTSGLDFGNYAYVVSVQQSGGQRKSVTEGYMMLGPSL